MAFEEFLLLVLDVFTISLILFKIYKKGCKPELIIKGVFNKDKEKKNDWKLNFFIIYSLFFSCYYLITKFLIPALYSDAFLGVSCLYSPVVFIIFFVCRYVVNLDFVKKLKLKFKDAKQHFKQYLAEKRLAAKQNKLERQLAKADRKQKRKEQLEQNKLTSATNKELEKQQKALEKKEKELRYIRFKLDMYHQDCPYIPKSEYEFGDDDRIICFNNSGCDILVINYTQKKIIVGESLEYKTNIFTCDFEDLRSYDVYYGYGYHMSALSTFILFTSDMNPVESSVFAGLHNREYANALKLQLYTSKGNSGFYLFKRMPHSNPADSFANKEQLRSLAIKLDEIIYKNKNH